jgi:cell division protease FtsH
MRSSLQSLIFLVFLAVIGFVGFNIYIIGTRLPERSYSQFLDDIQAGYISEVVIRDGKITTTDNRGPDYSTYSPDVPALVVLLRKYDVTITTRPASTINGMLKDMLVVLLLLGGWFIFSKKRSGNSSDFIRGKIFQSRHRSLSQVTFEDVAGISEAREELREIIDFLRDPDKYSGLGGRIPKGVLLQGLPGTGKTLLAKAIAGEASVPFYSIGGSDFVEMFAGLGASRVRKLFSEAKKQAPCIIFIDEIDAIGGKRSADSGNGSSDEREQTLNALLVEMDGFSSDETIIVVAATNRSDILDSALLRPGRFDRRITLNLPDIKGRLKILQVHARKVAVNPNVELSIIARSTPGFSGAELANLFNEAALLAARREKTGISLQEFEDAQDKIIMGLERKNAVISESARRLTAYHEAGHAIIAKILPETDPLHKITIIPRGHSLGLTQQLPLDEHLTYTRSYLLNRIMILLGGRLAEEVIFGRLTTGASNDLQTATRIAHRLVCEFGMNEKIGPISCSEYLQTGNVDISAVHWQHSQQTLHEIDTEIRRHIFNCYEDTRVLIEKHCEFVHMLAESLLLHETIDGDEVDIIYRCYLDRNRPETSTSEI